MERVKKLKLMQRKVIEAIKAASETRKVIGVMECELSKTSEVDGVEDS